MVQLVVVMVVALHTFSHHHVSGSDSDPNNQNDMQIYVRVPLRKRRGLIVTLSYDGQKEQCKIRNRKEKIKFITNLSIETNCTRTAHGPSNGSIHHRLPLRLQLQFQLRRRRRDDAASYRFRHSSIGLGV